MNTYCSGVIDLGYFTYVMTDKEFRLQHLQECLRGYLDFEQTFEEFLEEFNNMRPMYFYGVMVRSFGTHN